jgi:hypothetical protein
MKQPRRRTRRRRTRRNKFWNNKIERRHRLGNRNKRTRRHSFIKRVRFQPSNISNGNVLVVLYHSKQCGHCHEMMPQWRIFENPEKTVLPPHIKVEDVEESETQKKQELKQKYENIDSNMEGFPTIRKVIDKGNGQVKTVEFKGARTAIEFKKFAIG